MRLRVTGCGGGSSVKTNNPEGGNLRFLFIYIAPSTGILSTGSGTSRVRELEKRVRDLERLLGRKTMENEILKEAIVVARLKKPILPQVSWSDREDGSR